MAQVPLQSQQVFEYDGEEYVIDRVYRKLGLVCVDYTIIDSEYDDDHNIMTLAYLTAAATGDEEYVGWFEAIYMPANATSLDQCQWGAYADTNLAIPS